MEGESPDDFYEVTAAQKSAIEASDAAWARPPQSFIDKWNVAAGPFGRYNEQTGFFELNGITDIGYEGALTIYRVSAYLGENTEYTYESKLSSIAVRTFFPIGRNTLNRYSLTFLFDNNLQTLRFLDDVTIGNGNRMCDYCEKLKTIYGRLNCFSLNNTSGMFNRCYALEDVTITNLPISISFHDSPKLSYYSINYMITHAYSNKAITITVHPDVFAKLTGDTSNAAAAALSQEELALWMQLPDDAAAKNINFATT